ncbi:hypothetical protein AQUCO_02300214v1 [Aquilegia coerulea]|uniref:Uncharacterized protein n=1 Tax=Aquilegia coerulea TaxID=218851 RepID=A0A2G5DCN3_AQUCA|nr:hypothetical protein AQUCO_02300214v1 [Aquilegia coerulea]
MEINHTSTPFSKEHHSICLFFHLYIFASKPLEHFFIINKMKLIPSIPIHSKHTDFPVINQASFWSATLSLSLFNSILFILVVVQTAESI